MIRVKGPSPRPGRVYVGGTTHASTTGVTIFDLRIEDDRPVLELHARLTGVAHPTYLALHPEHQVLYGVSENAPGEVVAWRLDDDGAVERQRVSSVGDGPCHLSTDGRHLAVANYVSGTAAVHRLADDGRIGDLVGSVRHRGDGPHRRQDGAHAHGAHLDPRRPAVHVVDLGTDRIVRYGIGPSGVHVEAEVATRPGSGPRHLAFVPDTDLAVVVCELDNTVAMVDTASDAPTVTDAVSTLPEGETSESLAAAVVVDRTGERVYVSNRGHDSIAVFAHERGRLTPIGHVSCGGVGPRDITLDPTGTLLLAANQHSGDITGFDVSGSGLPEPLGVLAAVGEPTCVVVGGAGG